MTKLKCSAVACEYNHSECCCRPDIHVGGGSHASERHETCCESFREKRGNMTDRADYCHANQALDVSCSAEPCVYNADGVCSARSIQIGCHDAHSCEDTLCNTFSCSCGNGRC